MLYSNGTWPQFPRTLQNVSATITTGGATVGTGPVIGINFENNSATDNTYSPLITFSRKSASGNYNPIYASIGGIATGNGGDVNWTAGDLVFGTSLATSGNGPMERMRVTGAGNVGIGTASPTHKLHLSTGFLATSFGMGYTPSSWARGYGGVIMAGSANSDGSGWSYGGRIVEVDEGDGMNMAFDVNYTNSWTNNAMVVSGRSGRMGNVGIGTASPSQKLDVQGTAYASYDFRAPIFYDSANTAYYVDPASTSNLNILNIGDGNLELYKSVSVDMSNVAIYSVSNYYPVTINVGTEGCIIQIQNNLNTNVPSWSTHGGGFTLNLRWRTNGSGWGTTEVRRYIEQYHERYANQTICGGITQMTNNSTEVVWLRGGGLYSFKLSRDLSPTPRSTAYTVSGQTVTPTSAAQNTIWNSASGTSFLYTEILYDYNNTTYYCDPASTSNLNAATFAGAVTVSSAGLSTFGSGSNTVEITPSAAGRVSIKKQTGSDAYIELAGNGNTAGTSSLVIGQSGADLGVIYNRKNAGLSFGTNGTERLSISAAGAATFAGSVYLNGGYNEVLLDTISDTFKFRNAANQNVMSIIKANTAMNFALGTPTTNGYRFSTVSTSNAFMIADNATCTSALSFNAPIFYDSNNTAYYLDPNGTSNLLGLTVTNTISGSVNGSAATATALVTGNNYQVNSFGVGTAASGTAGEIRATNNITAYYSDDRLKTKLGLISDPIEKVKSLSGFYFEANETAVALGYTKQREVGVSAQEVQAILPEIIAPAPIDAQYMTVRYEKLIPLLIEAIKAQQVQIEELKAHITIIQQNLNNK